MAEDRLMEAMDEYSRQLAALAGVQREVIAELRKRLPKPRLVGERCPGSGRVMFTVEPVGSRRARLSGQAGFHRCDACDELVDSIWDEDIDSFVLRSHERTFADGHEHRELSDEYRAEKAS